MFEVQIVQFLFIFVYLMWNKKTRNMFGGIITSLVLLGTVTTNAAILSFTGVTETWVETTMWSNYFYTGCYSPVVININPEWVKTTAVDVKYFLSGDFSYQNDTDNYSGFTEWVFDTYFPFASYANADNRYGTGIAQTWTTNSGWMYEYINARSEDTGNAITGNSNKMFATIYLKPISESGQLLYYYLGPSINLDDSNVSSGTENYTQYVDTLTSVAGTGTWTFTESYNCPFKPYMVERAKYHSILGITWDNLALAQSLTNYTNNSLTNLNGYEIINPTSTQYSWEIIHRAGIDFDTTNYTNSGTWNIWTNQPITITFTGNEYTDPRSNTGLTTRDIKMVTGTFTNQYISLNGSNDREGTKTITVTGNVSTGISFYNRIGNLGEKFQSGSNNYYTGFMIDVFRFDNSKTPVTATVYETGAGYALVGLSWSAWTENQHADFTLSDDEFRIIWFSGKNTTNFGYSSETAYNDDLETLYVKETDQSFTMSKTGNIGTLKPPTAVATSTGAIMFTQTWSGYVYYSDIAGNVSGVRVDVIVEPKVTFEIRVHPAFRDNAKDLSITSGHIRLATLSGNTERVFSHNSDINSGTDSDVYINSNGTGTVDMIVPASWSTYLAVFKGTWMLSIWFTGIRTNNIKNTGTNYLDFSWARNGSNSVSGTIFPKIKDGTNLNRFYTIAWDITVPSTGQYDYINAWDLTNSDLYAINKIELLTTTPKLYMDFDLNNTINAIEQAIIIQYHDQGGWINEYQLNNKPNFTALF